MDEYDFQFLPGNNPFDQNYSYPGMPSTMPAALWRPAPSMWSLPILAYPQRPLQPDDRRASQAPGVPYSGTVGMPQPAGGGPHHAQSDIGMVQMRAPKF